MIYETSLVKPLVFYQNFSSILHSFPSISGSAPFVDAPAPSGSCTPMKIDHSSNGSVGLSEYYCEIGYEVSLYLLVVFINTASFVVKGIVLGAVARNFVGRSKMQLGDIKCILR
jgi:hypothetical protein